MIQGTTRSCGCLRSETIRARKTKHGYSNRGDIAREYITLQAMLQRCYYAKSKSFPDYGGRGITVCDRWRYGENGLTGIECFVLDLGRKPHAKATIERVDNSRGYEPSNCHWTDRKRQNRNTRATHWIEWNGERRSLAELCEQFKIPYSTVIQRINKLGWSPEKALTEPPQLQARISAMPQRNHDRI